MRRRYTTKLKFIWLCFVLVMLLGFFSYSFFDVVSWFADREKSTGQIEDVQDDVLVLEVTDDESDDIEIIEQKQDIPSSNPYWDYIKMNLINVNFKELKEKNSDTRGWIQVNGTNINYPFVQGGDNEYYLGRSFNKRVNSAGWIFMDYRNDIVELDKNTIIYGHSRLDTTMFGSLKNILDNGWLNNTDNHVIKMSTEYENTLWQVISVYHIPVTSDYLQVEFGSDIEFLNFGNMLINRSNYDFKGTITEDDKLLTLSTCYNNDTERVVLHAKLIKRELK